MRVAHVSIHSSWVKCSITLWQVVMMSGIVQELSYRACTRVSIHELPFFTVLLGRFFCFLTVPSVFSCHTPLCHDQVHHQDTRLKANDSSKQTTVACCETKCTPIPSSLFVELKTVHAHSFPNSSLLLLCHPSPSTMSPPCSTRSWLLKFG